MTYSCATIQDKEEQIKESNFSSYFNNQDSLLQLDSTQKRAFEALNTLQLQSKFFYSTFTASFQPCSEPDSIFIITQIEFKIAMQRLFDDNKGELKKLINDAVKAQEKYYVERCFGNSGTWIIRDVLGRRDIIMEW